MNDQTTVGERLGSRHLVNAGVALASCVFAVITGEIVLRIAAPIPLSDEIQFFPVADGPPVLYERNAFGLRSVSMRTRVKPPKTVRVLVLGASTTDEVLRNTAETWSGLLEAKLRDSLAPSGIRVEVAGYGRGGFTAPDLVWWARRELVTFQPDVVVTLLGVNDLAFKGGPGYAYEGLRADSTPTGRSFGATVKWWCQEAFQICRRLRLAKMRFDTWRLLRAGKAITWDAANLPRRRAEYQARPQVSKPVRSPDPIREFSDAMEALLAVVANAPAKAVVLGQPVLWKKTMSAEEESRLWFSVQTPAGPVRPSGAWLVGEMARYNDTQASLARRAGAGYVELDSLIPKDLKHYTDDCHYTSLGDEAVANAVLPAVLQQIGAAVQSRPR